MTPRGFRFATEEAAIKKPGRKDIALIFSDADAVIAGTFTSNKIKAAPVKLCMKHIRSGKGRAIIINSGNANACTGERGMRDAEEMADILSKHLGVSENLVYACSTGVIGIPLPMERIRPQIGRLSGGLGGAGLEDVSRAIMTTDTFPKYLTKKVQIGSKTGWIAGVCKGAGMIMPDMATMLCILMTDIAVTPRALRVALKDAVEKSFNRITVDGDMSTNDTALLMANGMLGNVPIKEGSRTYKTFSDALCDVTYELAKMVVKDGEGATKLVEVEVKGARTLSDAKKGAMAIANSLLVKTALYGNDPNWGRIIAALGRSGIGIKEESADIYLGGVKVFAKGISANREKEAKKEIAKKEVKITADLNLGRYNARILTCDISVDYVKINAEYTT